LWLRRLWAGLVAVAGDAAAVRLDFTVFCCLGCGGCLDCSVVCCLVCDLVWRVGLAGGALRLTSTSSSLSDSPLSDSP
jgi:hypothetical protein